MKERPILFKGRLVRAILEWRKTQTRRLAKFVGLPDSGFNPQFSGYSAGPYCTGAPETGFVLRSRGAGGCWNDRTERLRSPYGYAGDRLWVRETWGVAPDEEQSLEHVDGSGAGIFSVATPLPQILYRADGGSPWVSRWRPSIHMPRWASRLMLEVTGVRVERLQDISEEDAKAEGVQIPVNAEGCPPGKARPLFRVTSPYAHKDKLSPDHAYRWEFAQLWDEVNGKRPGASWKDNPWVWVIESRRVEEKATAANG